MSCSSSVWAWRKALLKTPGFLLMWLVHSLPRDLTSFIRSPRPIAAWGEGASNCCCLKWRSPPCPGWRCSYLKWWTWVCSCHVMVNKPWLYDSHRSDAVRWALGCRGCCVGQKKVGEPANWYPPCQVRTRVLIKRRLVSQAQWLLPFSLPVPPGLCSASWDTRWSRFHSIITQFRQWVPGMSWWGRCGGIWPSPTWTAELDIKKEMTKKTVKWS